MLYFIYRNCAIAINKNLGGLAMSRNLEVEFDLLQNEVAELKDLLKTINIQPSSLPHEPVEFTSNNGDGKQWQQNTLKKLMEDVKKFCKYNNHIGTLATVGYFDTGIHAEGDFSEWYSFTKNVSDLLSLIENRTAEKVLMCIGNNDRLNLLLALLKQPNTVAGLVENCGYTSPGQVYHHLRPLIAADLVVEDKKHTAKGTYIVQPHRVQGILILLEGIYYMTGTWNTQGNWDEAIEACKESP